MMSQSAYIELVNCTGTQEACGIGSNRVRPFTVPVSGVSLSRFAWAESASVLESSTPLALSKPTAAFPTKKQLNLVKQAGLREVLALFRWSGWFLV